MSATSERFWNFAMLFLVTGGGAVCWVFLRNSVPPPPAPPKLPMAPDGLYAPTIKRFARNKSCEGGRGLEVTLHNPSPWVVKQVSWELHGFEAGRSSSLVVSPSRQWGFIVEAGEEVTACYGAPDLEYPPKSIIWEGHVEFVTYFQPGEQIPRARK